MPKKSRVRRRVPTGLRGLNRGELAKLLDKGPPADEGDWWDWYAPDPKELWRAHGEAIVQHWVFKLKNYGKRPSLWWDYSAPGLQRLRVGGVGDPSRYGPSLEFGIPTSWTLPDDVAYHAAHPDPDDDSKPRVAVGLSDLPVFESQASFLKRRRLLLRGEAKHLRERDFLPETIAPPEDDDEEEVDEADFRPVPDDA
jgi:hypothetical protein